MKRLAIVLLFLCSLLLAIAAWIGEISASGARRLPIERFLSRALGTSVHFDALTLTLAPTALRATNLSLGDEGMVEVAELAVQVLPLTSLREGRPVVTAQLTALMIDISGLPDDDEELSTAADPFADIPPLRLSDLTIRDLHFRFRMGDDPVDIVAEQARVVLQRPLLRHVLEGSVDASALHWRRKDFAFGVDVLNATGGADRDGVWVERALIDGPDVKLRANSTNQRHRHEAVATFTPSLLGAFVDELALLGGAAQLEGTLSGNVIDPQVDAQLTLTDASFAQRPIGDLSARFTRLRSRLAFENIRIKGDVGRVAGAVQLVAYDEVPIQADLQWEDVNLEALLRVLDVELPFHVILDGRTLLTGMFDPLDLQVQGSGSARPIEAERAALVGRWKASVGFDEEQLEARAEIDQEGNQTTALITIRDGQIGGDVVARVADLNALSGLLPQPVAELQPSGRGEVSVQLAGAVDAPAVSARLSISDASLGGTPVRHLSGDLGIEAGLLTTTELRFDAGGGEGTLAGAIALSAETRNDWRFALRAVDSDLVLAVATRLLDVELPMEGGTLAATASCTGAWPTARVEADIQARDLHIYSEPFASVAVRLSAALPAWSGEARLLHGDGEALQLKATGSSPGNTDLSFSTDPLRLAGVRLLQRPELRGSVQLGGRLYGSWNALSGKVDLEAVGLADRQRRYGDLSLVATGQEGRWNGRLAALDSHFVADATLRAQPPFPYTVSARLNDANLSALLLTDESSQLTLTAELNLAGALAEVFLPSGTLRVSDLRLWRDDQVVEESGPILLEVARGRLVIRSLAVQYEGGRLEVGGEMSTSGDLRLEAQGQGDLVLLEILDLPIAAARGPFSIRAAAVYTPAAGWKLDGEGRVQDAMIDMGLALAFTRTNAVIVLRDEEVRIDRLEGRAGGGRFEVGGRLHLSNGPALEWSAQEVGFSAAESLEVKITGNGKLQGGWDDLRLSGSVEIVNALYDRNFEWADILPLVLEQLSGRALPRVRSIERPIGLDLIVYSRGGVFVDNNLANLETWLDLQLLGDTSAPVISGRVGFLDGEVFLRGRRFTITGGMVDFRDYYRNDPILNITAEARVVNQDSDYGLTMIVSGTASNPRIQFSSSDPTLSQTDVFSLATFGKTSAQLQREGSGVSAADALALVPTGEIEKRVGALVGFDRFEVEAVQSRSTGAIEPRVTIGKDLTDQIRALAWTSFGVESRRAVQLEYRVSRRVSLLGSWESDSGSGAGAFGGEVKFRYEFRKVPFSLLNPYHLVGNE